MMGVRKLILGNLACAALFGALFLILDLLLAGKTSILGFLSGCLAIFALGVLYDLAKGRGKK